MHNLFKLYKFVRIVCLLKQNSYYISMYVQTLTIGSIYFLGGKVSSSLLNMSKTEESASIGSNIFLHAAAK